MAGAKDGGDVAGLPTAIELGEDAPAVQLFGDALSFHPLTRQALICRRVACSGRLSTSSLLTGVPGSCAAGSARALSLVLPSAKV